MSVEVPEVSKFITLPDQKDPVGLAAACEKDKDMDRNQEEEVS